MNNQKYIGRFAPSPTGPLHYGTLVAAVVSFLQARANHGRWIVRIEDVDTTRCIKSADTQILNTLEAFGMHWDGEVMYQTERTDAYEHALEQLKQRGLVFPCVCSRKQLAEKTGEWSPVYPGTCKHVSDWPDSDYSVRIKVPDEIICFNDVVYGAQQQNLAREVGDFVIKRRDGLFAYQLAVVVDDAFQNITEVVRGTDLIDSTPRQIYLQRCLGYAQPGYLHCPLAIDKAGNKLGKSAGAAAINATSPIETLISILSFLGQPIPPEFADVPLEQAWKIMSTQWDPVLIPKKNRVRPAHPV
ncbi:MAG: tRNA glutamyl-Q(34) synthetase GluQRS [Gammaproteobacteria bacterium]